MSVSSPPAARPPSRWFRFRLRTLLIVAPLLAVGLGLAIRYQYPRYLEQRAVEEIEGQGGKLVRDAGGHVTSVELPGKQASDEKLRRLVPHLKNLPNLTDLVLASSPVTDEGIQHLADVPQLKTVYLADTKVTKQGIARLQRSAPKLTIDARSPNPTAMRLAARAIYDHAILTLAAAPGGRHILSGSGDGRVRVWNLESGQMVRSVPAHEEWAFSVAFHPSGRFLATGGGDNLIKLWSWPGMEEIGRFTGHDDDVHGVKFTPDGQRLVSTSDDWTVRIWDVDTRQVQHVLEGHSGTIPGLAVSPDGRLAASASRDGTVRLWDIASGLPAGVLNGHTADVMSVDFAPSGSELASASYDGTVVLWDVAQQQPLRTLRGHGDWVFAVRYSPGGNTIASVSGDGVRWWDRGSGKLRWHAAEPNNVSHAMWLDQLTLAASSADGSIALFGDAGRPLAGRLWTRFTEDFVEPRKLAAE